MFKIIKVHAKAYAQKNKYFLFPVKDIKTLHLLQNPIVLKIVMGFNNHSQRFTETNYLDVDISFGCFEWSLKLSPFSSAELSLHCSKNCGRATWNLLEIKKIPKNRVNIIILVPL